MCLHDSVTDSMSSNWRFSMMLRRISFGKPRKVGMLTVTGRKGAMIKRFRVVVRISHLWANPEELVGLEVV